MTMPRLLFPKETFFCWVLVVPESCWGGDFVHESAWRKGLFRVFRVLKPAGRGLSLRGLGLTFGDETTSVRLIAAESGLMYGINLGVKSIEIRSKDWYLEPDNGGPC